MPPPADAETASDHCASPHTTDSRRRIAHVDARARVVHGDNWHTPSSVRSIPWLFQQACSWGVPLAVTLVVSGGTGCLDELGNQLAGFLG